MARIKANKARPADRTAKMIRRYREDNDITQLDLARHPRLGYNYPNFIGMLESGKAGFPLERWKDFAEAIEANETEFLFAALVDNFPDMEPYLKPLLKLKKKR